MRAAAVFIALPLIATLLNALVMGSRHFVLSSWPAHAYHHLARQIVLDCGMSLLGLLLLHHFLMRRRERWAWWGLLVCGVAIFGGYWLSSVSVGLGEPVLLAYSARIAYTAIYLLGLVLCWRLLSQVHRKNKPRIR